MANLRLFTAVELPEEVRRGLARACAVKIDGLKWVDEKLLHITLKFVGDFPEERLGALCKALEGAHRPGGRIVVRDWVCFPERGKVRIVGAGVIDEGGELGKAFETIEAIAAEFGVGQEGRQYTPHVTVGRARNPVGGGVRERLKGMVFGEMGFDSGGFTLFSSELTNSGPIYRSVGRYII